MTKERKDSAKATSRSSAVFKTGAISLVFLVIGYQAALFINRAAMLGIEAARDHPDTVYVVRHVSADPLQAGADATSAVRAGETGPLRRGGNGKETQKGGSLAARSGAAALGFRADTMTAEAYEAYAAANPALLRTDTIRKNASHSPRVAEARLRSRKVENFYFNPNTVSVEELVRLGFSERQARSIDNYRSKGGRFRRKSDFAKSYVVADSVYRRLEPYIRIPLVDINSADSSEFDALPGIGPYFAAKMVEYRARIGGYSFPEQLMDIYNFGEERYEGLKDLIECSEVPAYPLWTLPAEELRLHPYIRNRQAAEAIVLYRENTPSDSLSAEGLAEAGILPEEDAAKLARCRIAPPSASGGD